MLQQNSAGEATDVFEVQEEGPVQQKSMDSILSAWSQNMYDCMSLMIKLEVRQSVFSSIRHSLF